MPTRWLVLACAVLASPAFTSQAGAAITSTFDADSDGWAIADFPLHGPYLNLLGAYTVDWVAAGGNPAGHIARYDPSSNAFFFDAPPKFLGDKSAYAGGQLSFSLFCTHATWNEDNLVVLVGSGGMVIVNEIAPPMVSTWVDYSIPLTYANFRYNDKNGAMVAPADFQNVIGSLAALRFSGEFGLNVEETSRLDNVRLVPEPAALGLLGLGAALAIGRRRRRA